MISLVQLLENSLDEKMQKSAKPETAADKAHKMGLDHMGGGTWGKNGKATHKTQGDNIVSITPSLKKKQPPKNFRKSTGKSIGGSSPSRNPARDRQGRGGWA